MDRIRMYMVPIQSIRVTFAAVILAFLPSLAYARGFTPTYTLTVLGTLPGYPTEDVVALNNQGDAAGTAFGSVNTRALLFDRGAVIDIAPTAVSADASAINGRGDIAGEFYDGTKWSGFIYKHGNLKTFSPPDATEFSASSINDLDQVAGTYSAAGDDQHVYIRQSEGALSDLGDFGLNVLQAVSINNQGRILITAFNGPAFDGENTDTYLTRPGGRSPEELPPLVQGASMIGEGMNQFGVVVGAAFVDTKDQYSHAFVYFEGKIKDLGVLPGGDYAFASSVNDFGQIVGSGNQLSSSSPASSSHGWIELAGTMRDLNELLKSSSSASGWVIIEAISINDRGEIAANASFAGGAAQSVLLRPDAILPSIVP